MLCEKCKKNKATVRYTEVVDNKVIKMNLCEECAKKKGVTVQAPFTISNLLAGLAELGLRPEVDVRKKCPGCGLSYDGFQRTGRLGCARCYEVFEGNLRPLLETIHRSAMHVGKTPVKARAQKKDVEKLEDLENRLRNAVAQEEYEEAARLRDEIQALKKIFGAKSGKK
jgi:protein arginine kinase activator